MLENIHSAIISACSWVNGFLTAPLADWYPPVMALVFFVSLIIARAIDHGFCFREWLPWLGSLALFAIGTVIVSVLAFLQVDWYRSYAQIQPFWSLASFIFSFGLTISIGAALFEDNNYGSDPWKLLAGFAFFTPVVHAVIMLLLYRTGLSTLVNHFYADSYAQVMALSFGGKFLFLLLPGIVLLFGLGTLIGCIASLSWDNLAVGLFWCFVFCPVVCFCVCSIESLAVFYGWGRVGLDICGTVAQIAFLFFMYVISGTFGFMFLFLGGGAFKGLPVPSSR